jgi:hypothetical protein
MTREDLSGLGHTQIGLYRREKDLLVALGLLPKALDFLQSNISSGI